MHKLVDSLASLLNESQELNFKRWPILNSVVHQNPMARGSFQAEVNAVRNYIAERIVWMDEKIIVKEPEPKPEPEIPTIGKIITSGTMLTIKDFDDAMQLYLYDMNGRTMSIKQLQPEETFSIRLLPGVYVIRLNNLTKNTNEYHRVLTK